MGLLGKLLKRKNSNYVQADNKGTLHNHVDQATEYWRQRKEQKKYEPFLLYKFTDESDVVRALLEIECIKIAEDTEELICILPLTYGYYSVGSDEYEGVLCGSKLSEKLFISAKEAFQTNKGVLINEKSPVIEKESPVKKETKAAIIKEKEDIIEKKPENRIGSEEEAKPEAEFVSEQKKLKNGKEMIIKMYKADSAKNAIAFLETKLVLKPNVFIIVKTPQGILGRSFEGIYKVRKKH